MNVRRGAPRPGPGTGRSLLLITLYYVVTIAATVVLWPRSALLRAAFSFERFEELSVGGNALDQFTGPGLEGITASGFSAAAISVVGVLVMMVPVAWSYIVIKRRGDYSQSVVHTLIILPIAIAGLVLIVQHSLALAFSLAGIVAGVRFRTTLKDVKDGVYVFLAIAVGLACGVQALGVAAVISIAFNATNVVLWWTDFGNIYSDQGSRTGALALGDVLAGPGSARTALSIGDKRLLEAMAPADLKIVAERLARMGKHIDSEAATSKERKAYSLLIVHTQHPGEAQKAIEGLLTSMAARWRLAEIVPGDDGHSIFEYLVRMRDGLSSGDLLGAIQKTAGAHVKAAEIRALTG